MQCLHTYNIVHIFTVYSISICSYFRNGIALASAIWESDFPPWQQVTSSRSVGVLLLLMICPPEWCSITGEETSDILYNHMYCNHIATTSPPPNRGCLGSHGGRCNPPSNVHSNSASWWQSRVQQRCEACNLFRFLDQPFLRRLSFDLYLRHPRRVAHQTED